MQSRFKLILFLALSIVLASAGFNALRATGNQRNFVVLFDFLDNSIGLDDALRFIFSGMLGPDDLLIIYSPVRSYSFSKTTLARNKAELASLMNEKLRGDTSRAVQNYVQVIRDMEGVVRDIEANVLNESPTAETSDLRTLFMRYRQYLDNLRQLRHVNDATLRQIAGLFRGQRGENHVVLQFEREFRPIPNRETLDRINDFPVFAIQANELFASDNLKEGVDADAIGALFKQVPLTLHFLYVKSEGNLIRGARFENSGDLYAAFSKIAKATSGFCDTITKPVAGLESVMKVLKAAR